MEADRYDHTQDRNEEQAVVGGNHGHAQNPKEEQVVAAGRHGQKQDSLGSQNHRKKKVVQPAGGQEYR